MGGEDSSSDARRKHEGTCTISKKSIIYYTMKLTYATLCGKR